MTDKSLKDKAIDIKGKKYVLVADRVTYFNSIYTQGSIVTELISSPTAEMVIVKATVLPSVDSSQTFTGHSQAVIGDGMVNKTAALENAETSAVGRALAMMGIGVIESIASADEMNKATGSTGAKTASEKQLNWIRSVAAKVSGAEHADDIDKWLLNNLQVDLQTMPGWKTAEVVKKINAVGAELDKRDQPMTDEEMAEVEIDTDKPINLDDIPY